MNGRDIGTVVFPDADLKFFLTADAKERAGRRLAEDRENKQGSTFDQTLTDITARDLRDSTRADSPLAAADDAIVIDSSGITINDVLAKMMSKVREKSETGS